MMKKFILLLILISISSIFAQPDEYEEKISELLDKMTLDEKIGQLVQLVGVERFSEQRIKEGKVGSILIGTRGADEVNRIQRIAVEESRLGIPLIFANDVIHGYRTIFPVPLAEASSWNPELIQLASEIAAFEAASEGTHWTYAPMVDICRDPRWGRIVEGSGEDPFLGSIIAAARVKGFQGSYLKNKNTVAACAKHYVAYGSAEGGRDYNSVDLSERTLREIYLPPFYSAVKSGTASIMSSFNDLNGIPASANYFTLTEILREEWKWNGVVISDYNSIGELVNHRFAADKKEAALKGLTAGVDIDMAGDTIDGDVYSPHLKNLVEEGLIDEQTINNSAKNVLRLKYKLGLFDNPYVDKEFFAQNQLSKNYKDSIALKLAEESIVLLKNEKNILPLDKGIKSIALIGPFVTDSVNIMGSWSAAGRPAEVITILDGIKNFVTDRIKINYSFGCNFDDDDTSGFSEAESAALQSDVVIIFVGEPRSMSGEAASRTSLDLPGVQLDLIKRIHQTGKPLVVVLMNGRPLTINWIYENVSSVIEAWYLGSQTGKAIANTLFGKNNPSGKLTITFPRSAGQIPIYYYQKSTGRPATDAKYTSKYLDSPNTPLFPFGYGKSYTTFSYGNIKISKALISINDSVEVSIDITNTGKFAGDEVVQLYIQDETASITLPVKLLKGFKKIKLNPGEKKEISFKITPDMLSFLDIEMKKVVEPGKFKVMIGGNSEDVISISFEVTE